MEILNHVNCGNTATSYLDIRVHSTKPHCELYEPCDNRGNTATSNIDIKEHSTNNHSEPYEPCDNSGNA